MEKQNKTKKKSKVEQSCCSDSEDCCPETKKTEIICSCGGKC